MIDLNRFCNPSDLRLYCRQPFRHDGLLVATNGHVMAVVLGDGRLDAPKLTALDCAPSTAERISSFAKDALFTKRVMPPIGPFEWPEKENCRTCKGSGKAEKETCRECDGEGYLELESGYNYYEVECKSCGGDGKTITRFTGKSCPDCDGLGKTYGRGSYVTIDGVHVNPRYLELIVSETNLQVFGDPLKPILHFKTADAAGLIMGKVV